jgi:protein-tyrosine phosphatase
MAEVFSWRNDSDVRNVLLRTTEALAAGRLVLLPTETGYTLCADPRRPDALATLRSLTTTPWTVGVTGVDQAGEFVPTLGVIGLRLARRCWPGPMTLLVSDAAMDDDFRKGACHEGCLALRAPAHSAILAAMDALGTPLAMATGTQTATEPLAEEVAVAVDDGPPPYSEGPSIVRVEGDRWELVREGVMSAAQIEAQLGRLIVFVCTGNTCRSPMAEALCKKRLADRLQCTPDELPGRGYVVMSAGLAAFPGDVAADPALEVARSYGMDLSAHRSRRLYPEVALQADALICMTQGHLTALVDYFTTVSCTPRLLSPSGEDLSDPVGQDESVYRACAERIWNDLEPLVNELIS